MNDFDVVVVGAGVAGCATAIELIRSGWRVAILHGGDPVSGIETLAPAAVRHLEALSIEPGSVLTEVVAWWGSENESRASQRGARAASRSVLADDLRSVALDRGAVIIESRRLVGIHRTTTGWEVIFANASECTRMLAAGYVVDATGRTAAVGRFVGAQRVTADRLFCACVPVSRIELTGTWTESVSDGWWNLCSSGTEGTLSFYSVAAVVRETVKGIDAAFRRTRQLRRLVPVPRFDAITIRPSGSSRLVPCASTGWVAVGDAASTVQPVASAGVAKALRDARLARRSLEHMPEAYNTRQFAEFKSYLKNLTDQYRLERRWPQSSFWRYYQGNFAEGRSVGSSLASERVA